MATPAPIKLLDEAFQNALSNAASLDQQKIIPDGTEDLFPDGPPTNVELVQECLDFYHKHHIVMDRAIQGASNLLSSPEGVARVKALEGSFEAQANNPLSIKMASEMLSSGEFGITDPAEAQGLDGVGIGVSVAATAIVGVLAGADIVFSGDDVIPRTWVGGSLKGGLSASAGLELSFWVNEPLSGAIGGWLLDLYAPLPSYTAFVRFMYIKERPVGATSGEFSAVSLQFPYGVGLPIRVIIGKPSVKGIFAAQQDAVSRPKPAVLDVVNSATGVNTIAVQENTSLNTTLKNTSGNSVALGAGATMTITMPQYFTAADVSQMKTSLPGWTFSYDSTNNNLVLTLSSAMTWQANDVFSFVIANVQSSNTPPLNQSTQAGVVRLNLNDTSFQNPIVTTAKFNLVWKNSEATLQWKAYVTGGFQLTGPPSGTTVAYAQPGNNVMELTTATDSSGDVWVLGYIFNYDSNDVPEVMACWWLKDSVKKSGNLITGNPVTTSGQTSTCYYSNGSYILVTPTFDTSG